MLQPGEILAGQYRIQQEIGAGGAGVIYLAVHLNLQKYVVVKKIKDSLTSSLDRDNRREVDIMKRLHHSYLPQVYDYLQIGSDVYTVMEYVEGHDLQYYLDRGSVFPEAQVRLWLDQLLQALDYLHNLDPPILHCDIKPSNIMITPQGQVCLIDFNVSLNHGGAEALRGLSVVYCAPEQYEAAFGAGTGEIRLDARTDLYSLAATFYRVVTGYAPSGSGQDSYPITFFQTGYSDGLIQILSRAMEREPKRRYASAAQMLRALRDIRRQDRWWRRWRRRQILLASVCGAVLVAGIACTVAGMRLRTRDALLADYQELEEAFDEGQYETVVEDGLVLLNEARYRSWLSAHEELEGQIYKMLGDGYFYEADYRNAADYYQLAMEALPEDGDCVRDYIVSLARQGKLTQAEEALTEAENAGLEEGVRLLLSAEIQRQSGDSGAALELLLSAESAAGNAETKSRICVLLGTIYGEQEDWQNRVDALKRALAWKDTVSTRRQLAAALATLAENQEAGSEEAALNLEEAISYYRELIAGTLADYRDVVNLAVCLARAGEREEAIEILQGHLDGETHGEVYAQLALLEYEAEQEKAAAERDFTETLGYARQAAALGISDENLAAQIDSLLETLGG